MRVFDPMPHIRSMKRSRHSSTLLAAASLVTLVTLMVGGCQTSGVGDPCIPQAIPAGGFRDGDTVIETTSVMCRTRVCLVYKFTGDPTREIINENENTCDPDAALQDAISRDASALDDAGNLDPTNDPGCNPREEIREHVYCSCRCGTTGDLNVPICDCPGGFECKELQQGGGSSVAGSYCVRRDN